MDTKDIILELRTKNGLSQDELAEKVYAVSYTHLVLPQLGFPASAILIAILLKLLSPLKTVVLSTQKQKLVITNLIPEKNAGHFCQRLFH